MSNTPLTRRRFLSHAVCLVALGKIAGCSSMAFGPAPHDDKAWLNDLIPDIEAAARLGQAYLKAHPRSASDGSLQDYLIAVLRSYPNFATAQTDEERFAAVSTIVANDYTVGDIVNVDGWVLSRTEARIYAVLAQNWAPIQIEAPRSLGD